MNENPYQVLGAGVARMFGRGKDWTMLMHRLEKQTPDNVSVLGPRSIGKTVFLRAVADYFTEKRENFSACVYWNVEASRLENDADFYRAFCERAAPSLRSISEEIANSLVSNEASFELIKDVFDVLDSEQKKVLLIMDGMDNLLLTGGLSKNVWDNLRSLSDGFSSIRYLTGSRKPLRDICSSPEARSSLFWGLFADVPIKLQAFDNNDFESLFAPFKERGINIESSLIAQLQNYSGGIPVLSSALCKALWERESISDKEFTEVMNTFVDDRVQIFDSLWSDCTDQEQSRITALATQELTISDFSYQCLQSLKQRGFVKEEGNKVHLCSVIQKYVEDYRQHTTDFNRLFGTTDDFSRNVKDVLEMRFKQIANVDEVLSARLNMLLQNFNDTTVFVANARLFYDRAIEIIFDADLLTNRAIPQAWINQWQGRWQGTTVQKNDRASECKLLNLMTGRFGVPTKVSRASYILVNSLKEVGDLGNHLQGTSVPVSYCAAICLSAIELCERLSRELS